MLRARIPPFYAVLVISGLQTFSIFYKSYGSRLPVGSEIVVSAVRCSQIGKYQPFVDLLVVFDLIAHVAFARVANPTLTSTDRTWAWATLVGAAAAGRSWRETNQSTTPTSNPKR